MTDTRKLDLAILREAADKAHYASKKALERFQKSNPASKEQYDLAQRQFDTAFADAEKATERYEQAVVVDIRALPRRVDAATAEQTEAYSPAIRIGRERHTYEPDSEHSILQDIYAKRSGDVAARQRLEQHGVELMRDRRLTRSELRALSGEGESGEAFLPPQHMQDELVQAAAALRPTISHFRIKQIPLKGLSVRVPKIKSAGAAAAQQNLGEVVDTDLSTEELESPVITLTGRQDMARQLFQRAEPGMLDSIMFPDLIEQVMLKGDIQALSGSGTGQNLTGIETNAATNAATWSSEQTIKGFVKALGYAREYCHGKRFLPATHAFVHPRAWAWVESLEDSSKRPLILPHGYTPADAAIRGVDVDAVAGMPVGKASSMLVVEDSNITTTAGTGKKEVPMFVGRPADQTWWEGAAVIRVYDDTENALNKEMGVRVELVQYAAMTSRFANAWTVIGGTSTEWAAATI